MCSVQLPVTDCMPCNCATECTSAYCHSMCQSIHLKFSLFVWEYFTVGVAYACIYFFYKEMMCIVVSCSFDDITLGISISISVVVTDTIRYQLSGTNMVPM